MGRKTIDFESLDEAISCYGRSNLIPIDNLKQIIFYVKNGCQPRFVWEKESESGKITAWFLKQETNFVYKKWLNSKPNNE